MIRKQKIEEFLEKVASGTPTPGGGAVAAIMGAMAASLVEMVVNLTKDRNKVMKKIENRTKILRTILLELADQDVAAFNKVMAAYKTFKEVKSRQAKIQKALQVATEVPLQTALLSNEVVVLARKILKVGNKNAVSDAKTAAYLAEAAKKSALENVKINLQYIKDELFLKKINRAVARLK